MMKLILVRHGQTDENISKTIQGQLPGKLSLKGIEQAKKVGIRLKDEKIDTAYVSDLARVVDTAKKIIQYHPKILFIEEKALRERSWGIWEGKNSKERNAFLEKQGLTLNSYKPEGGESFFEVQKRIVDFYQMLLQKYHKETVLLISHGGTLTALYLFLFEKSVEEYKKYHPQNAAITILEISDDKKHTVHVLNCAKHLE